MGSLERVERQEKARLEGNLVKKAELQDEIVGNRKEIRGITTLQNNEERNYEKFSKQKMQKTKQRVVLTRKLKTLEKE